MVTCDSLVDLQRLISLVAAPLIVCDLKENRVKFCNESASDLTGYDVHSITDLQLLNLFGDSSRKIIEAVSEIVNENSHSVRLNEYEVKIRRRTGRFCDVGVSVSSCLVEGEKYLIFTFQDLTELKKQENERKKLLEETSRISKLADIGRLTAGMAHELNNPLAILTGYLENLSDNIREGNLSKESLEEDIVPIEKAAQRMAKIIAKMLAQIRNEKHVTKPLVLSKIVEEALGLFQGILAAQSIDLKIEVDANLWIEADGTSIEQIITNIVTNASNALEGQKDRQIHIRSRLHQGLVLLEIWNNGKAIPVDVQKKLFTPFFTTKEVGEGTGLGLYMSYQIMKAHMGELRFYSDEKSGTAFILSFPLVEKPKSYITSHIVRALVVDDDTFFRKLMCKKMEKLNFVCEEASSGDEAFKILKEKNHHFDILIIDYKMPKMDGISLISEMKKAHMEIPVILISGSLSQKDLKIAYEKYNLFAYLTKPVENSELQILADKINHHVKNKKVS